MNTQTTEYDAFRRAVPVISPRELLEALEDPTIVRKKQLGLFLIQLKRMQELSESPSFTVSQRQKFMEMLLRGSGLMQEEKQEQHVERLPTITIVLDGEREVRLTSEAHSRALQGPASSLRAPIDAVEDEFGAYAT